MQTLNSKQQPYYVIVDTPNARLGRLIFYAIATLVGVFILSVLIIYPPGSVNYSYVQPALTATPEPVAPRAELIPRRTLRLDNGRTFQIDDEGYELNSLGKRVIKTGS